MTIQLAGSRSAATATISRSAVEAEGLVKTYPGGIKALKGVSFSVRPGAVFALLGPNGAGQSTIVKILTTLSRPSAGRASIAELRRRVSSLLARLDLTDARKRIARTLSGGMQRKLDVAMGLIHQPQMLFLDEPTTGLDPETRADMWHELACQTPEARDSWVSEKATQAA